MAKLTYTPETPKPLAMNAKRFALWLFIVSIVMVFASLTSAYIVRRSEGNWLEFDLPSMFYINTGVLLFSSVTCHLAFFAAKKDQLTSVRVYLGITLLLGMFFLLSQFLAWKQLVDMKVFFVGNPSGSFLYVLSGLHGAHIISGVLFILIMLIRAFQQLVHSKNILWLGMCTTYWHFLDGLWLYLFIFLLLNR
jgi:cytochrome c oxidase subunit 3